MKIRRNITCALIVAALFAVFLGRRASDEPRFEGVRLTTWLDRFNSAGSFSNAAPSFRATAEIGTNSLPYLFEILSYEDSRTKLKLIECLERINFLGLSLPFNVYLKSPACLVLRTLGTNASPIVPDLGKLALDEQRGRWANTALFSIGSAAAPGLEIACQSTNSNTRSMAAIYLSKVADGTDRGWSWGWNPNASGKRQLFGVGSAFGDEEDARGLLRQLAHADLAVRLASAEALMRYCKPHRFVLEELKKLAPDDRPEVRIAVKEAIMAFEVGNRP